MALHGVAWRCIPTWVLEKGFCVQLLTMNACLINCSTESWPLRLIIFRIA